MKKEEKTELTRKRILAAAMKEFGENGYQGASLNRICDIGIPKGHSCIARVCTVPSAP